MKESKECFENIFLSLIDGVILVSPQGNIQCANLATEEMFQQSCDSFQDKPLNELFPDQPGIFETVRETYHTGASFRDLECYGWRKPLLERFPVHLTIAPYLRQDQEIEGVLLFARDRTMANELEETSRHREQIDNLGVLSLGMAHEIKNPLVAISGSAQLLRTRVDKEHHEFLDVMVKESNRINRLVERMMAFARPANLKIQSINIHQLLEEIVLLEKQSLQNAVTFTQNYDPSLPSIEGDEDQLKQVFLNLIRNAIESMPKGGTLNILTRYFSHYAIRPSKSSGHMQNIFIEITDSGNGIAQEDLLKLFTPFHTTKSKGNGLGLPISLKIIENHSGKIRVTSEKKRGTTARVFLPLKQS